MTGFGAGSVTFSTVRISIELRTVNNRFADLRMRLPTGLGTRERGIRKRVMARVRRGRVDLSLHVGREGEADDGPTLNRALLESVLAAGETLRSEFGLSGDLTPASVLALPGMMRSGAPEMPWSDEECEALDRALEGALDSLDADRKREGALLGEELLGRVDAMSELTSGIREIASGITELVRDRLVKRIGALSEDVEIDPARIAQEAVLLADRADVTEEIVRLEGHLVQARELLAGESDAAIGKRLEFLVQEILRETNTIGSKSALIELTRSAMSLKAEVEKVREQVQNLE
jgi:uncharacterized protein (TIGR00255 family)